jgi:hypothetical protein
MLGRVRDWRRHRLVGVGLALYAVFVLTAPFEHHDLQCELKTPQHCTACTASVVGSDPHSLVVVSAWTLSDAGRAVVDQFRADSILLAVRSTGRSPPFSA